MEFGPLQCTGKSATKSTTKSVDCVADTNHESRQRDLCRGLSWFVSQVADFVASRWLCRKVGIMEFGLYWTDFKNIPNFATDNSKPQQHELNDV